MACEKLGQYLVRFAVLVQYTDVIHLGDVTIVLGGLAVASPTLGSRWCTRDKGRLESTTTVRGL